MNFSDFKNLWIKCSGQITGKIVILFLFIFMHQTGEGDQLSKFCHGHLEPPPHSHVHIVKITIYSNYYNIKHNFVRKNQKNQEKSDLSSGSHLTYKMGIWSKNLIFAAPWHQQNKYEPRLQPNL